MTEALITPEMLRWARERSHLSTDGLAQKAHVKLEQLASWEAGEARPSFRQAQELARTLHVPFGYLFILSPPAETTAIPDLRTVLDVELQPLSSDFLDLLNDVLRKQQWYLEYLQEQRADPLDFIGRYKLDDAPEQVARDIGQSIGVDETLRREAIHWEDFLMKLIRRAEAAGILVLRSGVVGNNPYRKLSVQEFRGFAISDKLAPLIFLNGRDAKAAQIFTLAHELAHLWIGESGISNPDLGKPVPNGHQEIERFCNLTAAELLVPRSQFLADWQSQISVGDNLHQLVYHFRVSSLVILRRAYELEKITHDEYSEHYRREIEKQRMRERRLGEEGGGDFHKTLQARNSRRLTTAILSATLEGRLLYRDAARLLSVKVKTLEGIATSLGMR